MPHVWAGPSRLAIVAVIAGAVGCLDLAHTNPYDPAATDVTIQVSGPDSTHSIQEIVQFKYTSDPSWSGPVEWKTSNDRVLHPLGEGKYGVVSVAAAPNDTVSAMVVLGTHVASHRVVVTQRVTGFDFSCSAFPTCQFYRLGVRPSSFGFRGHDANGFGVALPFTAQVTSSQPSVARIDGALPAQPGEVIYAVTPLTLGNSYFIMSSGAARDSALVAVVP